MRLTLGVITRCHGHVKTGLQKILRIAGTRHVTNVEVRQVSGCNIVFSIICSRHLTHFGHVAPLPSTEDHHRVLTGASELPPPDWRWRRRPENAWPIRTLRQTSDHSTTNCTGPSDTNGVGQAEKAWKCQHGNAPTSMPMRWEENDFYLIINK